MAPAASPPRPLPIRPRPMTGESPASYLRRLARANHLRPGYLRRYLRQPGSEGTIRLGWLAILAARPLPVLERALASPASGPGRNPGLARRQTRQADKPRLFAAIRGDARDNGLSIRALADRHGVHRRTVRQALASPWPAPRKSYERRSKLDPFKGTIDAMLLCGPGTAEQDPPTAKQIYDRLVSQHEMTGVSYSTVRDYVAGRLPVRPPVARNPGSSTSDAQQAITHLKELLEAIRPGTAARAQPHLDALELVISQALAVTGAGWHGIPQ
jgi:pyruvate/2-oxoglutarate dehydrogenase complex dihydrolipoamide acyltransferase (E2) component